MSPEYAHVRFTLFVTLRFALANIVVVTLEALFPVFKSGVADVPVAVFINVPFITFTLPVIVITPVHPLGIFPPVNTKLFPLINHVEIFIPVNPVGSVSVITKLVAVFGPLFPYVIV